jgi:hypothetical protein
LKTSKCRRLKGLKRRKREQRNWKRKDKTKKLRGRRKLKRKD